MQQVNTHIDIDASYLICHFRHQLRESPNVPRLMPWFSYSLDSVNISLALSSLDYLDQETEFVPWYAALGEIGYIRNMLLTKPIFGKFEVSNKLP